MQYHKLYGPSIPEGNWVPAPRYLLRRQRIWQLIRNRERGTWLEIGCGAGVLLAELSKEGFDCTALEHSSEAVQLATYVAQQMGSNFKIFNEPQSYWQGSFDYIGSFEVLEHIENHAEALAQWHSWLKPQGYLLLSVPAHMKKWTATDDWAGHFRRYEKVELKSLLQNVGFNIEHFESYGFPLANIIEPIRAKMHAKQLAHRQAMKHDNIRNNNAMSGIERRTESKLYPLMKSLPGTIMMRIAFRLQNLFANRDIGNGYIVLARKV